MKSRSPRRQAPVVVSIMAIIVLCLSLLAPLGATAAQGDQASPVPISTETPEPTATTIPATETPAPTEAPAPTATGEDDAFSAQVVDSIQFDQGTYYAPIGGSAAVELTIFLSGVTDDSLFIGPMTGGVMSGAVVDNSGGATCSVGSEGISLTGGVSYSSLDAVSCKVSFTITPNTGTSQGQSELVQAATITGDTNSASSFFNVIYDNPPITETIASFNPASYELNVISGSSVQVSLNVTLPTGTSSGGFSIANPDSAKITFSGGSASPSAPACNTLMQGTTFSGIYSSPTVTTICTYTFTVTSLGVATSGSSLTLAPVFTPALTAPPTATITFTGTPATLGVTLSPATANPGDSVLVTATLGLPAGLATGTGYTLSVGNASNALFSYNNDVMVTCPGCVQPFIDSGGGGNVTFQFQLNGQATTLTLTYHFTIAANAPITTVDFTASSSAGSPEDTIATLTITDSPTTTLNLSLDPSTALPGDFVEVTATLGIPAGLATGTDYTLTITNASNALLDELPTRSITCPGCTSQEFVSSSGGNAQIRFRVGGTATTLTLTYHFEVLASAPPSSVLFTASSTAGPPADANATLTIQAAPLAALDQTIAVTFGQPFNGTLTATGGVAPLAFGSAAFATSKGSISITPGTGAFTYTPNSGASGPDAFNFTVSDAQLPPDTATDTGTVTVNISSELIANAQIIDVNYESETTSTLVATGGLGGLTYSVPVQPNKGEVSIDSSTGEFTYTAGIGQFGPDSFTVHVVDSGDPQQSKDALVTVNIAPELLATDQSIDINFGSEKTSTLVAMGGFGTLTYSVTVSPLLGDVTINATTGEFTYTPNPGESGSDTFTVHVVDSGTPQQVTDATVTVNIAPELLVADQTIDVDYEGSTTSTLAASGGFGIRTYSIPAQPTKGTAILNAETGQFTYYADPGVSGPDSFTVRVADIGDPQQSKDAIVSVTIGEQLVAGSQSIDVAFEGSVDGILTATGGKGSFTFSISAGPSKGNVDFDPASGEFTYTATTNQTGPDTFTFTVTDESDPMQTATGTITIAIGPPDALITTTLTLNVSIGPDGTITGDLKDSVSGGIAPYTFNVLTGPLQGTLDLKEDGTFTYTANAGATGTDSFTYTVTDSAQQALAAAATFTGTVTFVFAQLPPTATPPATSTPVPTQTPESGTVTPGDPGNGTVRTPTPGNSGGDDGGNADGDTSGNNNGDAGGSNAGHVTQLPATGTGSADADPAMITILLASLVLLVMAALTGRRRRA